MHFEQNFWQSLSTRISWNAFSNAATGWTCGLQKAEQRYVGVVGAGADMCRGRMDGQPRSGQHIRSGLVARIVGYLVVGFADGVVETSKLDANRHPGASTAPGTIWDGVNAD